MIHYGNLFWYLRIILDDENNIQWYIYNHIGHRDKNYKHYPKNLARTLLTNQHYSCIKKHIIDIAIIQYIYIYNKIKKDSAEPFSIPNIKEHIINTICMLKQESDWTIINEMLDIIENPQKTYSTEIEEKIKTLIYQETEGYNWPFIKYLIESKNSLADPDKIKEKTKNEIKIKKLNKEKNNEININRKFNDKTKDMLELTEAKLRQTKYSIDEYFTIIFLLYGGCGCCSQNTQRNNLFHETSQNLISYAQHIYLYNITKPEEIPPIKLNLIYKTIGKERLALFMGGKNWDLIQDALKILYDSTYENYDNNSVVKMLYTTDTPCQ